VDVIVEKTLELPPLPDVAGVDTGKLPPLPPPPTVIV
jgi:hypothetical protein